MIQTYKIEELTEEQLALLPVVRDRWIAAGLSTELSNREEAEAGIALAYEAASLKPPSRIIWLDSPMAGAKMRAEEFSDDRKFWNDCITPSDYSWLSFYDALGELGLDVSPLKGLMQVALNAGWWWPLEDVAIVTERPKLITRDAELRLHNGTGPAVEYRDGFSVWAWHGTRVPQGLIEGNGWSVAEIMAETNVEIRRCAIEKMGWGKFIDESGMIAVGEAVPDPGNAPHTIQLYDLPEELSDTYSDSARILLCTNGSEERDGTRHRFGLVVPATFSDPVEAAASLYDVPVQAYRDLQVRR